MSKVTVAQCRPMKSQELWTLYMVLCHSSPLNDLDLYLVNLLHRFKWESLNKVTHPIWIPHFLLCGNLISWWCFPQPGSVCFNKTHQSNVISSQHYYNSRILNWQQTLGTATQLANLWKTILKVKLFNYTAVPLECIPRQWNKIIWMQRGNRVAM